MSRSLTGQLATFTARVISGDAQVVPTGAVQFSVDGSAAGAAVALDNAGQASFATATLAPGTHEVRALYQPESGSSLDPSEAAPVTQSVGKGSTATTLVMAPATTVVGQVGTLTAAVAVQSPAAGSPTGTVQFEGDGQLLGPPQVLDGAGKAAIQATGPAGDHQLRAIYSGDAGFATSIGTATHHIDRAATRTTLTSEPNPVTTGGVVRFLAAVDVLPPGDAPLYGSLQFTLGGAPFGPPLPLAGYEGIQVTVTAPPTPGSATVGVEYSGDASTLPSRDSLIQTVAAPAQPPAAPQPGPATPTPGAGTVASTSKSSLREIAAQMRSQLAQQGLSVLRKAKFPFTAVEAGTLDERVFAMTTGKAAAKRVLVATGRKRFAAPGKGVLRLRLTAAGKRLTRRAKPPKLAIVARFVPTTGAPVSVTLQVAPKATKGSTITWRIRGSTRLGAPSWRAPFCVKALRWGPVPSC